MKFSEAVGSSFNYVYPQDKRQQMFDFYMLTNLISKSSFDKTRAEIGNTSIDYVQGEDLAEEEKINYGLKEVQNKLLPQLKQDILDDIFFSMASEFRHIFDKNSLSDVLFATNTTFGHDKYNKSREMKLVQKFKNDFEDLKQSIPKNSGKGVEWNYDFANTAAHQAITEHGDKKTFVEIMQKMFNHPEMRWRMGYGKEKWADIAQAWLDLYYAQSPKDITMQIDHAYDLQHNTDTVFNKLLTWQDRQGDFIWIKRALNMKANMSSLHEIIDEISPALKKFALRAIKVKTGQSYEDFQKKLNDFEPDLDANGMVKEFVKKYIAMAKSSKLMAQFDYIVNFAISMHMSQSATIDWTINEVLKEIAAQVLNRKEIFERNRGLLNRVSNEKLQKYNIIESIFNSYPFGTWNSLMKADDYVFTQKYSQARPHAQSLLSVKDYEYAEDEINKEIGSHSNYRNFAGTPFNGTAKKLAAHTALSYPLSLLITRYLYSYQISKKGTYPQMEA